ncbi:MAG: aminopeptidase P family protein [Tissierellia bacterium]|nr:aminopeptidase P family protein [Tissierellia bacterium]
MKDTIMNLQERMKERNWGGVLIPSEDFHQSEYVGEHFRARAHFSGFTGSAGTLLVTLKGAYLWTDGRYFIQAARELEGSGISLMKMGEEGVPSLLEFIEREGISPLAVDGRCISVDLGRKLSELTELHFDEDPLEGLWNPPDFPQAPVWILKEEYAGLSAGEKLAKIRKTMAEQGAAAHLLTSLDDIAWLLNLRGGDMVHEPLFLSFLILEAEGGRLYAGADSFSEEVLAYLADLGITLAPYGDIVRGISEMEGKVLLDPDKLGYTFYRAISGEKVEGMNPTALLKAVKNPVEVENFKKAHLYDAIAWVKFFHWLKTTDLNGETEWSSAKKLEGLRGEVASYVAPSFESISAYGPNGAIVHYAPTAEVHAPLQPRGLYLSDTGGDYLEGSTDITRTVALGPVTEEEKRDFTLVLKGHIGLAQGVFPRGISGYALDVLARGPLWRAHKDFNHGTGHGVGYLTNIHEGPVGFGRVAKSATSLKLWPLEVGNIVTNEPGLYIEGKYGIRLENCMAVRDDGEGFLAFDQLTLVPFDLDALAPELLSQGERDYLNGYHKQVYEALAPHLDGEVLEFLKEATRPI